MYRLFQRSQRMVLTLSHTHTQHHLTFERFTVLINLICVFVQWEETPAQKPNTRENKSRINGLKQKLRMKLSRFKWKRLIRIKISSENDTASSTDNGENCSENPQQELPRSKG